MTGLSLSASLTAVCLAAGLTLVECGGWLFVAGAALAVLSAFWSIAGYRSPPGILGLLAGDVEVYPDAAPDSLWLDRFVSPHNVWLVAGLTMIAVAFLPPYLGL